MILIEGDPSSAALRSEILGMTGVAGVTVTGGAANTLGAYTTIGTNTFRYSEVCLQVNNLTQTTGYRVDLTIDNGASRILEDFFSEIGSGSIMLTAPLEIPSGSTIKARLQSTTAAAAASISITGSDRMGARTGRKIYSLTDYGATTRPAGTTLNGASVTPWATLMATTPAAMITTLYLTLSRLGVNVRTAANMTVELGIGSAGNEVTFATIALNQTSNNVAPIGQPIGIGCNIPPGSRLACRFKTDQAGATQAIGIAALGMAA